MNKNEQKKESHRKISDHSNYMNSAKPESIFIVYVAYLISQDLADETNNENSYIKEMIIDKSGLKNSLKNEEIEIIKSIHLAIEKSKLETLRSFHDSERWKTLTIRQKNIANLLVLGKRDKEISQILNFSSSTVRKENMLIARKLGVNLRKNS
jgi:DNA-binding NarL/FixJ family response regulator